MGRVWIAPLGTELDGPGWTEIGRTVDDGLVFIDDLVRDEQPTPRQKSRIAAWWRWHRIGRPMPDLSRVKREYHRRRR